MALLQRHSRGDFIPRVHNLSSHPRYSHGSHPRIFLLSTFRHSSLTVSLRAESSARIALLANAVSVSFSISGFRLIIDINFYPIIISSCLFQGHQIHEILVCSRTSRFVVLFDTLLFGISDFHRHMSHFLHFSLFHIISSSDHRPPLPPVSRS